MRILVTNDDGVHAAGLTVLARALADAGHDVVVVAPFDEVSGCGASLGPIHLVKSGVRFEKVDLPDLGQLDAHALNAPPAIAVIAACMGVFGSPPELVVAGINSGRNLGPGVLHSGTVGAALTAANFDRRGLAVGIETVGDHVHFETAAAIAVRTAAALADGPPCTAFNCNVPNLPLGELRGLRTAPLAPSGFVRRLLVDPETSRISLELGFSDPPPEDGSDEAFGRAGYATLTPLALAQDHGADVQAVSEALVRSWTVETGGAAHRLPGRDGVDG